MTEGAISPAVVDDSSIEYGHVFASYVKSIADTPADEDAYPDIAHVSGQVNFSATFPGASARGSIRLPGSPRSHGLIVTGDTFEINNSELVDHEGRTGVWLVAAVDGVPISWQATVTLTGSTGRTIFTESYIIHYDVWDATGEELNTNLPDLIPTPSRLEPPEGAAIRAAEKALDEIAALTDTNLDLRTEVEGYRSDVIALHGQTGDRLTAAEAARAAAVTAQGLAEAAQSAAEDAASAAFDDADRADDAAGRAEGDRDEVRWIRDNEVIPASEAAGTSASAALEHRNAAHSSMTQAGLFEQGAEAAALAASTSESEADASASAASDSAGDAEDDRVLAEDAADLAQGHAATADGHRVDAEAAAAMAQSLRWVVRGAWSPGLYEAGDVVVWEERAYYAQTATSASPPSQPWVPLTPAGGGASHWDDLDGKPTEFPPEAHGHPVTDIDATGTRSASTYLRGDGTWATLTEFRNSLISGLYTVNVKEFGAVGDGVADDHAEIMAALDHLQSRGGGTLYFPPGIYLVGAGVGKTTGEYANITIKCDSQASACIKSSGNFPPLIGAWFRCDIKNLMLDADLNGAPAMNIHMAESVVKKCLLEGWTGQGARLNDGTYGDVGLLNLFAENHIVQRTGEGIFQTYRWVDSWIKDNNVGSTGANLNLEGGPVRVSGNHFNGSPEINILLRGNKRVTITDNICEGSRKEAIVYEMPPWLTDDDAQVLISNNNISNGGKDSPGTYQAIRLEGVTGTTGLSGFSIFGNIFACEDAGSGWSHAVGLHNTKQVALSTNVWEKGYTVSPYLLADGSPAPRSVGNTSGNIIPVSDLNAGGTASSSTYLRGDGTWATPTDTTYSVPTQAEAEAGTATTGRAFSAQRVRQAADTAISAREWTGTQAQYDALGSYDPLVVYYVEE